MYVEYAETRRGRDVKSERSFEAGRGLIIGGADVETRGGGLKPVRGTSAWGSHWALRSGDKGSLHRAE